MTIETCGIKDCGRTGNLGNTIFYRKVYENGKRISLPLCSKCEQQIEVRRRPCSHSSKA